MFKWMMKKVVGSKNERDIRKMAPLISRIDSLEAGLQQLSDAELQAKTPEFKSRIEKGESLDALLPEAFAVTREAGRRVLGMRHYEVQMVGGIAIHRGQIAEMKTGEGKTLVGTLPVYLNALTGKGVHLVTVNDYLASRDAEWMGQLYRYLGLSIGIIVSQMPADKRRAAYRSDITYGQNNEFGFDYLRDNMKFRLEDRAQRKLYFAIVDEVDSILIDEARTPLIISGSAEKSSDQYYRCNDLIRPLKRDQDFIVDEKSHTVTLTEVGVDKLERKLKFDNLYAPDNAELLHHVHQALKAHNLYRRDQNYLVEEGKVVIVDEFTGRKMQGRRWSDGLHQAVEAKEGLQIQEETQTLATVTFQNYFRQYEKLSGMTGTADTEAEEFASIYDLDVLVIPTNRPIARKDHDDVVYTKERGKMTSLVDDIIDCHRRGQPVLVGTTSVDKSEFISQILRKSDVPHSVLNAKQHGREAGIVAQAGREGRVTIATNMAGRGTDIVLGGNPEAMARDEVGEDLPDDDEVFVAALERYREQCSGERQRVLDAGGLHIIGTERHESRRIDNQLRGRSGRQGDPGSSRFYLSLEDDLLRIFNAERIQKMMATLRVPDDEPIVHSWVTKAIENAQTKVEARNFDIRKNLLEYDDVMNQQRSSIYKLRDEILEGAEAHDLIFTAVDDVCADIVESYLIDSQGIEQEVDSGELASTIKTQFKVDVDLSEVPSEREPLTEKIAQAMVDNYKDREQQIISNMCIAARYEVEERYRVAVHKAEEQGEEAPPAPGINEAKLLEAKNEEWQNYERTRYLQVVDGLWKDHLQAMAHLKEGIHLQGYAQKDPKMVYKSEAFELFGALIGLVRRRVVEQVFQQDIKSEAELERDIKARRAALQVQMDRAREARRDGETSNDQGRRVQQAAKKPVTVRRERPKIGRNDPCWCGSGKKYKKCHYAADQMGFGDEEGPGVPAG